MRHASIRDLTAIYRHFRARCDVFPHVRQDRLRQRILAGQCVYQDGVVITYQQYRKRTRIGDVQVPAGAIMLHQILNSDQFNGAGRRVFQQFLAEVVRDRDLYLSVRQQNAVACRFYERQGVRVTGTVAWSRGSTPGLVYRLDEGGRISTQVRWTHHP